MTELRKLTEFIHGLTWEDLPAAVRQGAVMQTLDTISGAIGAQPNKQLQAVAHLYSGLLTPKKEVSEWGRGPGVPLTTGAFINAMAGHTLELDDVHTESKTHIGTVVIPAAWAMAEYLEASGKEFLTAVVCGYEVMARIGMAMGVTSHRLKGWHVTSTAGTFGAAAACARLLKLDTDQMVYALGLAGTQSFGLWSFLESRSSNKVLHPARAAQLGMESALLAKAGMSGPEHVLEAADGGLLKAMSEAGDIAYLTKALGERYEILHMDNKPYPCCRSTHCCIDAALYLKEHYGFTPENIDSITVNTYEVGYLQCGASKGSLRPTTPIEAKFSTPYCVSAALIDGELNLSHFIPDVIENERVKELEEKVTVLPDDTFSQAYPAHWGCQVTIRLKDGCSLKKKVSDASGSVANPLTVQQMKAKAFGNLKLWYPAEKAEQVVTAILTLSGAERMPQI